MNKYIPNIMSLVAVLLFAGAAVVITKGGYVIGAAMLGGGVFINSVAGSLRKQIRYGTTPGETEDKNKNQNNHNHKKRKKH